jgi:hypothetical protein
VQHEELVPRAGQVALPAAQRARRPVLAAELVEDRAVHARPGVLLEGRTALRVESVDGRDERLDATREEVVDLAPRRQLAHLPVHDVLDDAGVGQHEPVAQPRIAGAAVLRVYGQRLGVGEPAPLRRPLLSQRSSLGSGPR